MSLQSLHDSPLNLSASKQQYTFSKGSRFNKLSNPTFCEKPFYDLASPKGSRMPGIGYGERDDTNSKLYKKNPAPWQYQIKSEIDQAIENKKGLIFGVSREKMELSGVFGQLIKYTPGPGSYQLPSTKSNVQYSIKGKNYGGFKQIDQPGPGQYQIPKALTEKGDYFISKFKNSGAATLKSNSPRFAEDHFSAVPGPGKYPITQRSMKDDGKYFINGLISSPAASFTKARRQFITVEDRAPGPGRYGQHSDFGQLKPIARIQKA